MNDGSGRKSESLPGKAIDRSQRETEDRYHRLANLIDQGFCVMEVFFDDDGVGVDYRFLEVNPVFERHTGLVDAVGKTARELVPNLESTWPERYGRIAMTGKSEHFVDRSEAMGRWFEVDAFRIGAPEQRRVALLFTDISNRKAAEEALRESEERFRDLADNMSQFAWMADRDGSIVWYNRRWYEYTGTTLEQMKGWGWQAVHHPDHVGRVVEKISHCFRTGETWEDTFPLRSANGDYRWFLSRAIPIRDSKGRVLRWFGTNTDITQQRQLESKLQQTAIQLAQANRRKDEFLANVSHEIRSPMTAILGYLDLIELHSDEDRRHVETIRRNGEFLLTLINDILDLSKIEAGQFETDAVAFDPKALIGEVVDLMTIRAQEGGITLTTKVTESVPEAIVTDAKRVRQVLINLVGNAIKFTPQGSVQMVTTFDQESGEMVFDVIDTGIGIPATDVERLFQPFEQMDGSITRRFGGTGLGLAICRRLATVLGGSISAASEEGAGSRFRFKLPVGTQSTDRIDWRGELAASGTHDGTIDTVPVFREGDRLDARVLVVDDRPDIRFLLQRLLERFGCDVATCENGEEALRWLDDPDSATIDAVIMDMQMPGMDGLTAVRHMRQAGFSRPVIALTANAMDSDRERCLNAGYTDYLSKPIDKHLLFHKLKRRLAETQR
ncbi:response regulator [Roseiconus lacunae]|uniref:histidine kinase n=1 Tax=Roseiconus lacunae TaxID=2605694 RepID=A0ABT7PP35_9BACT|nr:response regulator [Roseiconus lacunae]MDM4018268.1 response regulator [Roseiconus lacunae]